MTDIRAGAPIGAGDFPTTRSAEDSTAISNITSTTYITGSPVVATTFTAPVTGRVEITVTAGARDNGGTNRVTLAPNVFLGTDATGTEVLSTASTLATEITNPPEATAFIYGSRTSTLEGLTAGSTYYARAVYKVDGGTTADLAYRGIIVRPLP